MGNNVSKNDPLPSASSAQNAESSTNSSSGDLESDDAAVQQLDPFRLSSSSFMVAGLHGSNNRNFKSERKNELAKSYIDENEIGRKSDLPGSRCRRYSSDKRLDLDLEIGVSLARLLNNNDTSFSNTLTKNSTQELSSSFESDKSDLSITSPVFTYDGESKEEDLLLSVASSPRYHSEDHTDLHGLESSLPRDCKVEAKGLPRTDAGAISKYEQLTSVRNESKIKEEISLDRIIYDLVRIGHKRTRFGLNKRKHDKFPLDFEQIIYILSKARSIFLDQPTLVRLRPAVKIVGDIHGQFHDLIRIFNCCGYPPHTNYLFLGDYVDRGHKSLETIILLLCYKIKYPENFFMLRGNHESANITKIYGFYDECKRRLPAVRGSHRLWRAFIDVFNTLPIAATINDKIFCIHGGLSPELREIKQIESIKRPTDVPDSGLLADLLWSDPDGLVDSSLSQWPRNDRGVSYLFGRKHVDHFCAEFKFELIVRGHMVVEDGYEFFNKRKLVTVFLAPNYCGEFDNYGAVMAVDTTLCCSFELIKPQ